MTIAYRCDGPDCSTLMDEDTTKIALTVEKKIEPQSMEPDEDGIFPVIEIASFGMMNDTHFCSMACLASWAMTKHLEEATS